jgi:nitric oxide dioxygenase
VSNWLHEQVRVGDALWVGPACGDFTPSLAGDHPLVLISAGVGITPLMSALKALMDVNPTRPVVFAHASRSAHHQALRQDLKEAARALPHLRIALFHEQLGPEDALGADGLPAANDGLMRLSPVIEGLDMNTSEFHMCGPLPFMRAQWAALQGKGVPMSRLHREVFGPELLDHILS